MLGGSVGRAKLYAIYTGVYNYGISCSGINWDRPHPYC